MSSWVLGWAWDQGAGLSDGAHLLLCYMADQADDDGVLGLYRSVSRDSLAGLFKVSVDTIDRRIRELKTGKLCAVENRSVPNERGAFMSITNVYRLASPPKKNGGRNSAAPVDLEPAEVVEIGSRKVAAPESLGAAPVAATPAASDTGGGRISHTPPAPNAAPPAAPVAAPIEILPSTSSSAYPPVGDASIERHTMSLKADWLVHVVADPMLDPTKAAGLVSGAFQVDRWVRAGADLEQVVLPVILGELMKRRTAGKGPLTNWGILSPDVRAAAVRFLTPIEDYAAQAMETQNGPGIGAEARARGGIAPPNRQPSGGEPSGILGAIVRRRASGGGGAG